MKRLDRRERNRLKGERFEELVELLFRSMGYATKMKTGDNFVQTKDFDKLQIDIIAEKPGDRVLVECKNYSLYPISQKEIHYFCSALEAAGSG
ncbi:MAG: restriction endonuclease [Candidatus Methanosuratincola verstraetei]|jgi:restriction endonuclease Mrr